LVTCIRCDEKYRKVPAFVSLQSEDGEEVRIYELDFIVNRSGGFVGKNIERETDVPLCKVCINELLVLHLNQTHIDEALAKEIMETEDKGELDGNGKV